MNKSIILFLTLNLISVTATSSTILEQHYKEDGIKILISKPDNRDNTTKVRIGETVVFNIKIAQDKFFSRYIINANAHIHNTSQKKVRATYSLSFHAENGELIVSGQGSHEVKPNDDAQFGSALFYVEPDLISKITNYKLRTQVVEVE